MSGFSTRALGAPQAQEGSAPAAVPIHQTSTFAFDDPDELAAAIAGPKDAAFVYTRWNNPTRAAFEETIASLEGAEASVSFSSGMSAVTSVLMALTSSGSHVVASPDLYGGTFSAVTKHLPRAQVDVVRASSHHVTDLVSRFNKRTQVCYVETISNPRMSVVDVPTLARECASHGVTLVVDATFTSPYLSRPLKQGADVVLHSATKYIGGHHDLTAGVASGSSKVMSAVRDLSIDFGGSGSPFDCWLALRGLATLSLRIDKQSSNALGLAQLLEGHDRVSRVWYPGLSSHEDHEVAKATLDGFGGMLAFDLNGSISQGRDFLRKLKVAHVAASLGGIRTLAVHPASVTHTQLTHEERTASGITDGLVRISVGIEDEQDILNDFTQALSE